MSFSAFDQALLPHLTSDWHLYMHWLSIGTTCAIWELICSPVRPQRVDAHAVWAGI